MSTPKRGEIWIVNLGDEKTLIQRPVLIVSPWEMPRAIDLIIGLVVTDKKTEGLPLWVSLGNERWIRCEVIHTMLMSRAVSFVERVNLETMLAVRKMLCNLLPLEEGEEFS